MNKEAFLKGFLKGIKRFSDDIHRTAKQVETGKFKINVDATPELKAFVKKELDETKKQISKELSSRINPNSIGLAALGLGTAMGVGNAVGNKMRGGSSNEPDRGLRPRPQYGQPVRTGRAGDNQEY